MPFNHEAVAALPSGANADAALIRAMCERRFAYVLDTGEDSRNFVAVDPSSGVVPLYLIQSGNLFQYDSADSTTTHDGVTCLVSSDGKRYKTNAIAAPYAVLSRTVTAQPSSPTSGDSYIVPTAATGAAWAGQDGKIAIYTARGWQFAISPIGREIYVRDVDTYYHRNASGTWTAGVGAVALQTGSVTLPNVLGATASFVIKVENQTTNAPPVSPSTPTAYIIGPSPTGSWSGNAGKLAICLTAGSFTIIAPATGDQVYDKARGAVFQFNGTAWTATNGVFADSKTVTNDVRSGTSTVIPWDDTIPQISEGTEVISTTVTPKSVTNKLRVRFEASLSPDTGGIDVTAALFLNSVTNAIRSTSIYLASINHSAPVVLTHEFVPATTSPITLSVRVGPAAGGVYWNGTSTGRRLGGNQVITLTVDEIIA
ncbi:DUF2793 domain-containing protein [Bradyrhizobium sp. HKCCYLS2038]|uniref:DUF2793 domain-containing protein n=1 Tax=Bradyrhizobium sp. HKCCYLS2038 TaxID=3420764 RepID=UPI003EB7A8B1